MGNLIVMGSKALLRDVRMSFSSIVILRLLMNIYKIKNEQSILIKDIFLMIVEKINSDYVKFLF
jgi:hypothetical protein